MKRLIALLLLVVMLFSMFAFTGCDDGQDYTCGYCGREMGHYYSYINGRYTCRSCTNALRND